MKIVEIQAGAAIVMQISMNGQTIELPTVSVTVQDGALVTEAIRINGKLLGLDNSAIHVNLMCIRENKAPIIYDFYLYQTVLNTGLGTEEFYEIQELDFDGLLNCIEKYYV